jgi:hypothetical protein
MWLIRNGSFARWPSTSVSVLQVARSNVVSPEIRTLNVGAAGVRNQVFVQMRA